MELQISYKPLPKQMDLHKSPANEILFGGSAGPGKSHALRFEALKWCLLIPKLQVYLFRRVLPELERNHIIPSLQEFPSKLGRYKEQKKRWEFHNGAILHFVSAQYEKDVFDFQGAEINLLCIDELTMFTEFMYDFFRARVRCALPVPDEYKHKIPGIICASNPGGVGHEFVKRRWVDFCSSSPNGMRRAEQRDGGMLRQYIPALLRDNPILMQNDPDYINRLDALPEPYRSAYKNGDWDIFMGQMFTFSRQTHVIKPLPIPAEAEIVFTFDWGFGRPYSILWFWLDNDRRLYLFSELYGCLQGRPDTGLRQTDAEIADAVIEREKDLGIWGRRKVRLCDPTCFNKKPDYAGGGQGESTAEVFARRGVFLNAGDPARKLKIRQFHQRLRVPKDGTMPMLVVYDCCPEFIRTIPLLQPDQHNPEDVDKKNEDHNYDSAALACMGFPVESARLSSSTINIDAGAK
jgi:hypothetical protein